MPQLQLAVCTRQLTPFPEQTCPLLPVAQERVVSWETGIHCWLRHTMLFPHLVPACTRPGLMVSPPGRVVKELWVEKRAVFSTKCQVHSHINTCYLMVHIWCKKTGWSQELIVNLRPLAMTENGLLKRAEAAVLRVEWPWWWLMSVSAVPVLYTSVYAEIATSDDWGNLGAPLSLP